MSTLLYNPNQKSKDQLISEFVVRNKIYEEIMTDLETSKMLYPEQHYVLLGQRGTGKTTLLNRIKYGIQDSSKLQEKLIPIIFDEEQYNISELANLWESVGQYLEDYYGFDGIYAEMARHIGKKDFEELIFDILEKHLTQHNKNIVLLIDNLGDLLKKLLKVEVHRLREILQTKKEIRLIAGSPFYLDTILDYQQPLFEFFKVIRLDGLNQNETKTLLLKLAEINGEKGKIEKIINETPERIETLRTLTGGVPRTIALMYRIFTDYNEENSVKDLERILDAVTPLYKHRMDDLPIQQQKIVDAIARNWDAISVKDLKGKVRIDSKNISAQLQQLQKNQIIEKKETKTKNHLYYVKERFFNIWYLMRYGRKDDRQKVIWLVKFLESWCSSSDLKMRILNYVDKINSGELDISTIEFYGNVYATFKAVDPETRVLLKKSVPKNISGDINISDSEIYQTMLRYENEERWNELLEIAENIKEMDLTTQVLIWRAVTNTFRENSERNYLLKIIAKLDSNIQQLQDSTQIDLYPSELEVAKQFNFLAAILSSSNDELDKTYDAISRHFTLFVKSSSETKSAEFDELILRAIFISLLQSKHYNLLHKIFTEITSDNLQEMFKPIYFVLVYFKDGKDSIEYLKAGPELEQTISEIIDEVNNAKE